MEELNLVEILKDCPKGTELYSPMFGPVYFDSIKDTGHAALIFVHTICNSDVEFYPNGKFNMYYTDSECLLFPSKDNRDWSTFKVQKPKFDVSTLQPFDKVLVRDGMDDDWQADLFSHRVEKRFFCIGSHWGQCIPYNDDTKHLIGTTNKAPDFYVTWDKE